jgi:hypothetical protein
MTSQDHLQGESMAGGEGKFLYDLFPRASDAKRLVTATVINCPGRLGDETYRALEITVEGVNTPFQMVLALPAVTCRNVSGSVDVAELYDEIAGAINDALARVTVTTNVRSIDVVAT